MRNGYVYILSNPSMPGLVKIGRTTRSVEDRASELYQTGVPTPFFVEHEFYTPDCEGLECDAHRDLSDCRVSEGREFFRCTVTRAHLTVMRFHIQQVCDFVAQFLPEHTLVGDDEYVDPCLIHRLAEDLDVPAPEVTQILDNLEAADLGAAMERHEEKCRLRVERRLEQIGNAPIGGGDG